MKNKFRVHICSDFDGNIGIGGTIYVTSPSGTPFPDEAWYDLPLDILGLWCWNLSRSFNLGIVSFEFCFMDGPYRIKGKKNNDDVTLAFEFDDSRGSHTIEEFDVKFCDLVDEIFRSSNRLIDSIEKDYLTKIPATEHIIKSIETAKRHVRILGGMRGQLRRS